MLLKVIIEGLCRCAISIVLSRTVGIEVFVLSGRKPLVRERAGVRSAQTVMAAGLERGFASCTCVWIELKGLELL